MMETNDYITLGFEKELTDIYTALVNEIVSDDLSRVSAICFFKHIPIRGKHEGWSDKVYNIADKCHRMLYEYCKKKKYISPDSSYMNYINGALFLEQE